MGSSPVGHLPGGILLQHHGPQGPHCTHKSGPWVVLPKSYQWFQCGPPEGQGTCFQVKEGPRQMSVAATQSPWRSRQRQQGQLSHTRHRGSEQKDTYCRENALPRYCVCDSCVTHTWGCGGTGGKSLPFPTSWNVLLRFCTQRHITLWNSKGCSYFEGLGRTFKKTSFFSI